MYTSDIENRQHRSLLEHWQISAGLQIADYDVVKKTTTATVLRPFVRDYPGEPVPEEKNSKN